MRTVYCTNIDKMVLISFLFHKVYCLSLISFFVDTSYFGILDLKVQVTEAYTIKLNVGDTICLFVM
jgi:hypothetical protein